MRNSTTITDSLITTIMDKLPKSSMKSKEFVARDSLLTELFEIEHIQTIRNIFIALFIALFLNTAICDYVDVGKINIDFQLLFWTFGKFHLVVVIWMFMFFCTLFSVHRGFKLWAENRNENRMYDYVWLLLYVSYLSLFLYLPVKQIIAYELPFVSTFIILCEQIRLLMKTHSFVRSNVPNVLRKSDTKNPKNDLKCCPNFSKFLYFLFAPTLIYKDEYPRSSGIRWQYVISNFTQVIFCILYMYFLGMRFMRPLFEKFGLEPLELKVLVVRVFSLMLPSILIFLLAFFILFHSWLNAFAEMLTFSDRMFYQDWWNSRTLSEFYRKWNVVVQDWLYEYIYKDVAKVFSSRKVVNLIFVFTFSAGIHEFILSFTLRFFYPVLYIIFGPFGAVLVILTKENKTRTGNISVWVMLLIGNGLLAVLYGMEWYARINCPPYKDTYIDYFVPRSLVCYPMAVSHANSSYIKDEL